MITLHAARWTRYGEGTQRGPATGPTGDTQKERQFMMEKKHWLPLNIQFFAGDGAGGAGDAGSGAGEGTGEGEGQSGADGTAGGFSAEQEAQIQKLIKSAQDSVRNELGKKNKDLLATIEQLKNQGKSKEQLAEEAQQQLEAGQRELLKSKNEFYAVQKLAKEGLDAELLPFVTTAEGEDEEARNSATDEKVQKITEIVNAEVKKQVDAKFKDAGYNPGSGNAGSGQSGFKSVLETIRANQIKK